MQKTFIGPHLRRLRLDRKETQAAMGKVLGISPSYVNLLENNERSVSVAVLLRVFEAYGVDWRDIAEEDGTTQLADLRAVMQDPLFMQTRPDLAQLRAATGLVAHGFVTQTQVFAFDRIRIFPLGAGVKDAGKGAKRGAGHGVLSCAGSRSPITSTGLVIERSAVIGGGGIATALI